MSRRANTLSALNSAPGAFGSVKTMVVLSGGRAGAPARLITMNRVMLVSKSWMPRLSTDRSNTWAARSDAMAPASVQLCSRIIRALPAVS
jgi:hypothetical protein